MISNGPIQFAIVECPRCHGTGKLERERHAPCAMVARLLQHEQGPGQMDTDQLVDIHHGDRLASQVSGGLRVVDSLDAEPTPIYTVDQG
jgi:hypothetical protein